MNQDSIQNLLQSILGHYKQARNQDFSDHPIRDYFKKVVEALKSLPSISLHPQLSVNYSIGQGKWSNVPWIAIMDSRETTTTQYGVYCVFLFAQDMSGVYLTLNQGITRLINEKGRVSARDILRSRAKEIRLRCDPLAVRGFKLDDTIDLRADPGRGTEYEVSTIAHKLYEVDKFPDSGTIVSDINALIVVYQYYIDALAPVTFVESKNMVTLAELIPTFMVSASNPETGLRVRSSALGNFAASILAKRFLILTGLAGSGKTKLAQAFARWLTESPDCYRLIAVGADWTGSENILGYPSGLDKDVYVTTAALDLILHAHQEQNQHIPHFLILDEMNLSHVERYFADILSAIESGEEIHLHQNGKRNANGVDIPPKLQLPKNLFIIGTVNVDETTYMFSPKVLDRANVIEFRMEAGELESFLAHPVKPNLALLDGKGAGFGQAFVHAAQNPVSLPDDVRDKFEKEMILFFNVMQRHGAEFGYRVAYEAARFVHFYKLLGNHTEDESWFAHAFDCVVIQKFLPKLHGSRAKLGPLLKTLWFLCVNVQRGEDPMEAAEAASRSTDKHAEPSSTIPTEAPYPLSADKIARMWRLLRDNGFASFAES